MPSDSDHRRGDHARRVDATALALRPRLVLGDAREDARRRVIAGAQPGTSRLGDEQTKDGEGGVGDGFGASPLNRARELHPEARPRIITDNGPQFIARDFKEFIRLAGMTHVRTSPYYPQSNGKIERWHTSLKAEAIPPRTPLSLEDARRVVTGFVEEYNERRFHSAIGYVTPRTKLEGREEEIFRSRDAKLEAAREERARKRRLAREAMIGGIAAGAAVEPGASPAPC